MVVETQFDELLTVREVARILHVHPNTLRRWSDKGLLKAFRITERGDRRYMREDIAQFLRDLVVTKA